DRAQDRPPGLSIALQVDLKDRPGGLSYLFSEHEAEGDLRTAGIGAVGESLGCVAGAKQHHAVGCDRPENAARVHAVSGRRNAGIVNRVAGVEGFEVERCLYALTDGQSAREAGIHVVDLVDVEAVRRHERYTIPTAGTVDGAVGKRG